MGGTQEHFFTKFKAILLSSLPKEINQQPLKNKNI